MVCIPSSTNIGQIKSFGDNDIYYVLKGNAITTDTSGGDPEIQVIRAPGDKLIALGDVDSAGGVDIWSTNATSDYTSKDNGWTKPVQKYCERSQQWALANWGLALSARLYNTFVISVISFIWQLEKPPEEIMTKETQSLKRMSPGPFQWILAQDLYSLKETFGMPMSFKSIEYSALAAKARIYIAEDIPWDDWYWNLEREHQKSPFTPTI